MEFIKIKLKKILTYKQYERILQIYGIFIRKYQHLKYRERKISNGAGNPDKTFYIIRGVFRGTLFQYYMFVLSHIMYALSKDYIPIVDMTSAENAYKSDRNDKPKNVWEYYFKQPAGFSLEDIECAKNIVLSDIFVKNEYKPSDLVSRDDRQEIQKVYETIEEYVQINAETKQNMDMQFEQLIKSRNPYKTIGVHVRGTDYLALKPKGHSIQPTPEQAAERINELIHKWGADLVYICTEDDTLLNELKEKINVPVVYTDCSRLGKYKTAEADIISQLTEINKTRDPYMNGLEYLTDIYLLAQCDYLISGAGLMGSVAATLMNGGKYEDKHIIDLGIYK